MQATKVPTSLLSAIGLFIDRVWYQTRDRILRTRSGGVSLRTSTATKLPQEIVEIIITHLIYDSSSLQACSLTCRSWYIAAVPHLHHTLITQVYFGHGDDKRWWPESFQRMHKLGLFPLIKKFQVPGLKGDLAGPQTFSPKQFDRHILRQFLSLTNVRELGIDLLDIPSFMPKIRRHFGHFAPTVRSLTLREPKGSRRQIIFFIGLFQHLEDLKLIHRWVDVQEEPPDDLTLIPPSVPPLRGRLTMACFKRVGILKDMIVLFGGIRFRYMDLFCVKGMRLILGACAETLETVRLYPDDPRITSSFQDFDLSRNKSLRTVEVTARYTPWEPTSNLSHALSTITSPVFSELVVVYRDYDFYVYVPNTGAPPTYGWSSEVEKAEDVARQRILFQAIHELHKAREFKLVLCADVWHYLGEHTVEELRQVLAAEKADGGLGYLSSEPLVTYSPRVSRRASGEGTSHTVLRYGDADDWTPLL